MMYANTIARSSDGLDNDALRRVVPSVFALEPWQKMSERYRFVPTIDVLDRLRTEGFVPVRATQGRTRIEGKGDFTKHMIRLRHRRHFDDRRYVGQEFPEIVLLNSHDGTSAYQLYAGIFRLVCLNGMVVESSNFGKIKASHRGGVDLPSQVIDASYEIIEQAPAIMDQVESMKALTVSRPHQEAFAAAASELRPSTLEVRPPDLLSVRRMADRAEPNGARDLWTTVNVVQENILRGGVRARNAKNERRHTRAVTAVADDIRINRGLWRLAEEMQKLAA
jgi:Domain of unknown function (DUF932)